MKALVIYYSNMGHTDVIARRIAGDLQCETIEVKPDNEYGGYLASVFKVFFQKITGNIPTAVNDIPILDDYDVILIGYPIWFGAIPAFYSEFLEKCSFVGKKVVPFATAGSMTIEATLDQVETICSGAEILYPFNSSMSRKDDFLEWSHNIEALLKD